MPRVYMDKYGRGPLFSIDHVVGLNMCNDRKDVMLIQFFLKAIMHSGKIWLAGDTKMTPPEGGQTLEVSGVWDETSGRYLGRWEELRSEAKAYWAHGRVTPTQFAGTVVPYHQGGKKIIAMNEMLVVFFGKENHDRLNLPGADLDPEVRKDLFYDPVYDPNFQS